MYTTCNLVSVLILDLYMYNTAVEILDRILYDLIDCPTQGWDQDPV